MSLFARDIPLDQMTADERWNLLDRLLSHLADDQAETAIEPWHLQVIRERLKTPFEEADSISLEEFRERRRSRNQ